MTQICVVTQTIKIYFVTKILVCVGLIVDIKLRVRNLVYTKAFHE